MRWIDVIAFTVLWLVAWRYAPPTWIRTCGLLLGALSLPLWLLARHQLGRSFTVRAEARQLVTRGLYSRLRHPIYIFGGLAFLGAILALQDEDLLIVYVVFCVLVQGARARRENRVLEERFGQTYRDYSARTWL